MKGVSRIDSKSTHGWLTRVYYHGNVHSKFFSDGVHGGKRAAFKVAKLHRVDYIRHQAPKVISPFFTKLPKNNTSGVVGVSETYERRRDGSRRRCFHVTWCPRPNVIRTKRFYHHDFKTRDEAFEAATQYRKKREKEILRTVAAGRYK